MSQQQNPANETGVDRATRTRIPMSVPQLKLEVPPIPGFHLHWMRGSPERIAQAQRAGYEFVLDEEVQLNNNVLGSPVEESGNTDLGSRVSMIAGGGASTADGQPMRLFLMKIPEEWYLEDQKLMEDKSANLAQTLSQGMIGANDRGTGETAGDISQRYVDRSRTKMPDFFKRKAPRTTRG